MTDRFRLFLSMALVLLIGLAPAVSSAQDEAASNDDFYRWTIRGYLAGVTTNGDFARDESIRANGDRERTNFKFDGGDGVGFALERHFSERLGLELGVLLADLEGFLMFDVEEPVDGGGFGNGIWGMNEGDIGFMPFTLGLNYHLTPNSRPDLYIGPFVGLAMMDDVTISDLGESFRYSFDDEFVFGINAGLDIPFKAGGPWALAAGVRWMDLSASDPANGVDLGIDPLIATVGATFRTFTSNWPTLENVPSSSVTSTLMVTAASPSSKTCCSCLAAACNSLAVNVSC